MRNYAFPVLLALAGTLALGACSQGGDDAATAPTVAEPTAATGSSADCSQLVAAVNALQPAAAGTASVTAPSLAGDQPQAAAAAGSVAAAPEAAVPQLSEADKKVQTACYSYLSNLVQGNLKGMTTQQPYAYLVPAGDTEAAISQRQRQLGNVSDVVLRGVTPGNLLAFAGPSSNRTADLLVAAFQNASSKSLNGVIVVFVGASADEQRVAAAVKPSGADFRFVSM